MIKTFFLLICLSAHLYAYTDNDVDRLKKEIIAARTSVYGWCSQDKLLGFIDLVLEVKPDVCVEIGVYEGASFLPVALTLKFLGQGMAIAIDPWDFIECIRGLDSIKYEEEWRTWLSTPMDTVHSDFEKMIKRNNLENYSLTYAMTSEKAAPEIEPYIDILHIDGSHSEYSSTKDVELYLPKVRSGGYIWLSNALCVERYEAVNFLLERCDVVKFIDDQACMLFQKR